MSKMNTTRFRVRDTYTFGILKSGADILYPEWRESRSKRGKYFHDLGTPSVEEYLSKNPDRWPHKSVIYFYTTKPDGTLQYFGQMTPPPPALPAGNPALGDGPTVGPQHHRQQDEGAHTEFLMSQLERMNQWLRDKDDEIRGLYAENASLRGQLAAAQEEVKKMVEMRRYKDEVEEAALKHLEKQQKQGGGGLGDPMQLIGLFASLLGNQNGGQPGFQGLNGLPPQHAAAMPPHNRPTAGMPAVVPAQSPPLQRQAPTAGAMGIEYAKNVIEES